MLASIRSLKKSVAWVRNLLAPRQRTVANLRSRLHLEQCEAREVPAASLTWTAR